MTPPRPAASVPLSAAARERAMNRAIAQGVLGQVGGWLMGGPFLTFFAMELGAKGTMMGVVLAVGNLVSLLRIFAPYFVNRSDDRKKVWLYANLMARALSVGLPILAFPQYRPHGIDPVWFLVLILCLSSIAATIGDVSWLSWFADIVPESRWGRYFSRRNVFMSYPAMAVQFLGGWGVDAFVKAHPEAKLTGFAGLYALGICFHLLAIVPMLTVPNVRLKEKPAGAPLFRDIFAPFRDENFRRYAFFWMWLMLGSGISQPAFQLYQKNYLGLGLLAANLFQIVNQVFNIGGQTWAGRLTDRFGNKPIIILGLIGAAGGPFFWIPTSPGHYGWMYGAYVLWGFGWAGVHLGCQNLMLKIAPRGNNVGYIACVQAVGGISLALFVLLGGWLLDRLTASGFRLALGFCTLNAYHLFFLLSFLGRSSAALWVFRIREPRARTVRHMLRALMRARAFRRRRSAPPAAGLRGLIRAWVAAWR